MYSRGLYLEKSKVETRASDSVVCPPKNRNMNMVYGLKENTNQNQERRPNYNFLL